MLNDSQIALTRIKTLKALFTGVFSATKQSNCLSKLVAIGISKDSLYNTEDEDLQADTVELEEASLTEESPTDEAESVKDEDFDVQVINNLEW